MTNVTIVAPVVRVRVRMPRLYWLRMKAAIWLIRLAGLVSDNRMDIELVEMPRDWNPEAVDEVEN